jgi:hypothetical protein
VHQQESITTSTETTLSLIRRRRHQLLRLVNFQYGGGGKRGVQSRMTRRRNKRKMPMLRYKRYERLANQERGGIPSFYVDKMQ